MDGWQNFLNDGFVEIWFCTIEFYINLAFFFGLIFPSFFVNDIVYLVMIFLYIFFMKIGWL